MKAIQREGGNRGVATILVVGVLGVFLIFFLVVGIDYAYIYVVRGQMQNAADAASLAGAAKVSPLTVDNNPSKYLQEAAREEAWKFACKNFAAGESVYLVGGLGNPCDSPPADLNDSNAPIGDIVIGHWREGTLPGENCPTGWTPAGGGFFCAADGTSGLQINSVKVVARRTENSPGGRVSLFFGHLVDWAQMDVSQVAIAIREPLAIAATPLCVPSCGRSTPLTTVSPNLTPGLRFFFRTQDGSPNVGWSSFLENNTSQPVISAYIRGERIPPPICNECIFTTSGLVVPSLCAVRERIKEEAETYNVNGVDVVGWKVIIPILPATPCPSANGTGCITEDPGYQPGDPYEVIQFTQVIITDAIPTGNCPGDSGPYATGKPGIVLVGIGPGTGANDSTVTCIDCNDPSSLDLDATAKLVR